MNKKLWIMTLTSWLKYDHEIKKMIGYVNFMLIYVFNKEKKIFQKNIFQKILILC